jgi:hypothetical protein
MPRRHAKCSKYVYLYGANSTLLPCSPDPLRNLDIRGYSEKRLLWVPCDISTARRTTLSSTEVLP